MVEWQGYRDQRFHYDIDGWKTISKFRALEHAGGQISKINFYCYDHVFDRIDWSRPISSWPQLLRTRCQQLRDRYEYLCLWFSGGWDSTTVLRAFIENDIRLDELIIFGRLYHADVEIPDALVCAEQIKKDVWPDLNIKFIGLDHDHHVPIYRALGDQWIDSPGSNFMFPKLHRHFLHYKWDKGLAAKDTKGQRGDIEAHDKPKVYLHEGRWYSFIPDSTMVTYFGTDIDLFFLNDELPELYVMQVHMSIDYFESLFRMTSKVDPDLVHRVQGYDQDATRLYFAPWNRAIGRTCLENQSALHGWNKFRAAQNATAIEGLELMAHCRSIDLEAYGIYTEGINNVKIATGIDLWKEVMPTILSKSYHVRDLASDLI